MPERLPFPELVYKQENLHKYLLVKVEQTENGPEGIIVAESEIADDVHAEFMRVKREDNEGNYHFFSPAVEGTDRNSFSFGGL